MHSQFHSVRALLFVVIACSSVFGQAEAQRQIDSGVAQLGKDFVSNTGSYAILVITERHGGTGGVALGNDAVTRVRIPVIVAT
jgi:hypothetical protein